MKIAFLVCILLFTSSLFAITPQKKHAKSKDTISTKAAAPTTVSSPPGNPFQHEILTSFTSGGFFSSKSCKDCKTSTEIGVNVSYLYFLQAALRGKLQVGVEGGIASASIDGNSNTYINLLGVGAYNRDPDFKESIFLKGGFGIYTVQGAGISTETKLGLFIAGGKRFGLFDNVTFSPEARVIKKGDIDFGFEANLLNFSIYWN